MSDLLQQLGITKEEVLDRIVNTALGMTADYRQTGEESWEDIPLSSVVDKKITVAIGDLIATMKSFIQTRIENIMDREIENIFTLPFQPIDCWGNAKGEPTTIRDSIANEAKAYWNKDVDSNGKEGDSYGTKTSRAVYYAKKVMTEVYDKELVSVTKQMAQELKAMIPATLASEISKTVVSYLK